MFDDQSYGLRFDIYERIHLSEDVAGIAELEEIELLPHIQVISQDEQAALRGHLLLTGLYRGEGEEDGTQRLDHFIPVEITVPLNRVTSLDEIAVEIENFDVDLLSQRSLNITGVLSLRGIETTSTESTAWKADEFTVVHAPEESSDTVSFAREELDEEEELAAEPEQFAEREEPRTEAAPLLAVESTETEQLDQNRESDSALSALHKDKESLERTAEPQYPNVWHFEHEDETELLHPESNAVQADLADDSDIYLNSEKDPYTEPVFPFGAFQDKVQPEDQPEDREMRIAVGSKKESDPNDKEAIGFSSLLSSSRSIKELEQQQAHEDQQAAEAERDAAETEDVKWKNLFLGSMSDQTPFRRVRLCIVQREETLETIADRYQLSPRELLLYNRLSEQTIEEGQILYIP